MCKKVMYSAAFVSTMPNGVAEIRSHTFWKLGVSYDEAIGFALNMCKEMFPNNYNHKVHIRSIDFSNIDIGEYT